MSKKICDLCSVAVARVLCESDEAALCWGCDAAVHGANFLVARHVRALLCRICLGRTAWLASGARVGPAASLCCRCSEREEHRGIVERGEGEVENQAVPLKLAPPLSDDSSSSSTFPADDLSCASSTQSSDSRSTGAESGVAEHEARSHEDEATSHEDEATSSSNDNNPKQSKRRKRSFAAAFVHATSSSKLKL